MKILSLLAIVMVALLLPGCSWLPQRPASKASKTSVAATTSSAPNKTIVTPDMSLAAKVVAYNAVGRFVVLSFPADQMPKLQQTLSLYRMGMKVAEVKITGPQQENNIVADLTSGEPKVGDTVRAE